MATGQITHVEIPADDVDRARRFYGAVAGWEFSSMEGFPDYWLFRSGEGSGGAIGKRGESVGTVIRNYIEVASIDAAAEAASRHGGTVVTGRTEVPGQGFYAVLLDPEANEIALWENPA
jgi:predicted enzyme related to lactoylglutathione lyase